MNRALLIKFLAIVFIALLILIPLGMIEFKISERSQLRAQAEHSVASSWTGSQTIFGPVIAIDYEVKQRVQGVDKNGFQFENRQQTIKKTHIITPAETTIDATMSTSTLKRGIYPLTVFTSAMSFSGFFHSNDVIDAEQLLKSQDNVSVVHAARIVWQISDPRGLNKVSSLSLSGKSYRLLPGTHSTGAAQGLHLPLSDVQFVSGKKKSFDLSIDLRGMHSLNFRPAGKQTDFKLQADWPHPKFVGAFLPSERRISSQGFTAQWNVNEYAAVANNGSSECIDHGCGRDYETVFGVELVNPIDVYLQSERAVKYGFLFVSMIFIGFVVFELLKKLPIHPVQYALVGVAIAVFFLLLISLSEHLEFGLAYSTAAIASVAVISFYLRTILRGWQNASLFSGVLVGLYALLFLILQSEDYALLMGALLCFFVLATVMLLTRNIDWYAVSRKSLL